MQAHRAAVEELARRERDRIGGTGDGDPDRTQQVEILPLIADRSDDAIGVGDDAGGRQRVANGGRGDGAGAGVGDGERADGRVVDAGDVNGAIGELQPLDVADVVGAIAGGDRVSDDDKALGIADTCGRQRERGGDRNLQASRLIEDGVLCLRANINRGVDVGRVGVVKDLAQDLAAAADHALVVLQEFDMQPGVAVDDVVALAAGDGVVAGAAEQNIAA